MPATSTSGPTPATSTHHREAREVAAPEAATPPLLVDALGDQRIVIPDLSWEQYVAINDAVVEHPGLRMFYCEGRLTLLTESRRHGFNSRCLFLFVLALAEGLKIPCTVAASATFRRRKRRGGVEGDETFYFGPNAEIMRGGKDIDLETQPPPDLAVEVEVSHSADDAVKAWGCVGVPEVWRFDPTEWTCTFWKRRRNGTYQPITHSLAFPMLAAEDVVGRMKLADEMDLVEWQGRVRRWVRRTIATRARGGDR